MIVLFIPLVLVATQPEAGTLGRISAIQFAPDVVSVDGERLRVVAESRILEASDESGESVVASLRSLRVGDYVIVEREGDILKSATRVQPAGTDIPPGGAVTRVLPNARQD